MLYRAVTRVLLLSCVSFLLSAPDASSLELLVSSKKSTPNTTIALDVTIDQAASVSAALFELSYNTDFFQLTQVDSPYFDTFANQWSVIDPQPVPMPPTSVHVDGQVYDKPLLFSTDESGAIIAGVRLQPSAEETTLLTLYFQVAPGAPDGVYPVIITPLAINEEALPVLVTMQNDEPDPALACIDLAPVIISGSIAISVTVADSDRDGIDDAWEIHYFGDLATANSTSDFDRDGYTDLQEYLNHLAGTTDNQGNQFDPTKPNSSNGPGFTGRPTNPRFWMLFNTVIQNAIKADKDSP